ncbi:MAG: hypothetical protein LBJ10_03455 [Clostridiales bacterium]|jgi:hypothetical protein|nr:hypothetical protein [Clostridiales bacterium]
MKAGLAFLYEIAPIYAPARQIAYSTDLIRCFSAAAPLMPLHRLRRHLLFRRRYCRHFTATAA